MAYDDTMKEGGNAMDLAITDVENIIDNASPEEAIEMMTSQMKAEKDPNAKKAYQDGIDRVKRGLATENSDVSTIMNEGVEEEMSNYMVDQMDLNPYDFYFDDTVLYVDPKHYLDVSDELGDYAEKRYYKIKKMEAPDLESLQYNEAIGVGDMVKVKDQEIIGKVVSDFGNKIVIRDEDAETDDDELEFKKSDVELYPYPGLDEVDHKNVGDVSFKDKDPLPGKFQGFGISQSPQYRAKAKKILDKMGIKHFDSGTKGLMIHSKPEDQEMIMRAIKTELGTPSYTATFYEDIERVIEAYGAANHPKYDEKAVERELQKAGIAPRSRQAKAVHALLKGRQQDEQAQSPYAIGMAKAMKMYKDKPPLSKRTIKKAHSIAKGVMGEAAKPLKVKALSDNAKEMLKKALKSKAGRSRYNYGDTIELEVDNPEDVPDQLMQAIHDELEQEAIQGGMLKAKDVGKYPDRIDNIKISAKAQEHPELPGAFFPKVNITGEYMKEEKTNTMEAEAGPHMAGKSSWTHSAKGGRVKYKDSKGKEFSSEVNSITTRRFRDDTDTISGEVELEMGDIGSSKSYFITDNPNLHKEVMNIIKKSSGVGMSPVIRSANDVNIDPNGNITLRDVDVDSLNKYMDKAGSPIIPYQALVKKYPTLKGHFMSLPGGKAAVGHMDVDKLKDSVEIKEGPTSDRAAEIVADIANSQEGGYFETEEALEQFLSDNLPSFSDKDYDHMKAVEKAMNMIDDHVKGYAYEDNTVKFNEEIQRMKYLAGQSKVLENEHRGYANSPKEQIIDSDTKLNKMSGGANKPKKTYPKVAGGDNPMQKIEEDTSALEKALQEELEIIKKED